MLQADSEKGRTFPTTSSRTQGTLHKPWLTRGTNRPKISRQTAEGPRPPLHTGKTQIHGSARPAHQETPAAPAAMDRGRTSAVTNHQRRRTHRKKKTAKSRSKNRWARPATAGPYLTTLRSRFLLHRRNLTTPLQDLLPPSSTALLPPSSASPPLAALARRLLSSPFLPPSPLLSACRDASKAESCSQRDAAAEMICACPLPRPAVKAPTTTTTA